ncbi:MAG TPA: OmpA family protein [Paludibacteraceae bacterium]|nr:OmpA family protein [Paludibacteraceae bacterium]HQB68928.1 OmpA family protein [Paludibacteraceae bacterium]HRS67237.1 OmpA family protein [Paludibacteraceae bacterium]
MKLKLTHLLLLGFTALSLLSCGVSARVKKADKHYEQGEYFLAGETYRKVQSSISAQKERALKAEVNFKMGECYSAINNHTRATKAYAQAIKYKYPDSIVYLRQAKAKHALGKYQEAAKDYGLFLKSQPTHAEALAGLEGATEANNWIKIVTRYVVKPATEFNSRKNSDFAPSFMGSDASSIVFTTNRENTTNRKNSTITGVPNNDLFTSRKNAAGKWEKPDPLEGEFNTDDDEGVTSLTADGKTLYFTRCRSSQNTAFGGEIYTSNRSGGQWTAPQKVILFKDSSVTVAHPAISPDGTILYFVSDHASGFGGKDIWKVEKTEDGWSMPENLGNKINTAGNELFPYVRHDGTLYFSSDGHPGFGGLDIFKATKDSLKQWKITNMMTPINSNRDDFGITFEKSEEQGYFSSNRNQSRNYDRIYYFELPELVYAIAGKVTDEKGEAVSDAIVKLIGDNGDNVKMRAKKDGSYRIKLSNDANYIMLASARGYLNSTHKFSTQGLVDSKTFTENFKLPTIGKPIPISNIFFEFGKSELTPASEESLQGLVKMLTDNPNIAIEISAHTDMIGSEESNLELSEKRAQTVVNFLIKSGIDKGRLTSKGYGESMPVVVDKNMAKMYKFIKEGELLDENLVNLLTKEQQDIVNSINRRTEFKVTKTTYNLY